MSKVVLLSKYVAFIAVIFYQVFGIMYLVQTYNTTDECLKNLWPYILTSVSLMGFNTSLYLKKSLVENVCLLVLLNIINTAMPVWGGVELIHPSCDNMNNVWQFALGTFALQTFILIYIVITGCYQMVKLIHDERTREPINTSHLGDSLRYNDY